jgi:hypothetical protein
VQSHGVMIPWTAPGECRADRHSVC